MHTPSQKAARNRLVPAGSLYSLRFWTKRQVTHKVVRFTRSRPSHYGPDTVTFLSMEHTKGAICFFDNRLGPNLPFAQASACILSVVLLLRSAFHGDRQATYKGSCSRALARPVCILWFFYFCSGLRLEIPVDLGAGCVSFWYQCVKERRALHLTASQKQTADGACQRFVFSPVDVRSPSHEP